jgi:hypothetical protein
VAHGKYHKGKLRAVREDKCNAIAPAVPEGVQRGAKDGTQKLWMWRWVWRDRPLINARAMPPRMTALVSLSPTRRCPPSCRDRPPSSRSY